MTAGRILIVEDERIVALHLQQQLERLGYDVPALAVSGVEALDCIREHEPDIVLMDINIEGEFDGIETAARMPLDKLIPVIYLTAYSEDATLNRARATKPYGYLLKPFAERELHATLQMVLERRDTELALRESEKRLRQAQKMEVVGNLTGGIAHDFNNLLAVIVGNLELAEEKVEADPDLSGMLSDALAAAYRGATLTRQLLAYSRQQPLNPTAIDPNQLVVELVGLLKRTLDETIEIQTVLDATWQVFCDRNQLENALLNLAVNARDAMPDGGRLIIETADAVLDQDYASQILDVSPGDYVLIAVSDTGVGIPRDIQDKVLEPFFTTKPPGQGSGLGLSMVYGLVKQSNGHVAIYSEIGNGTKVALYLPNNTDGRAIAPGDERQAGPVPLGQGESVLMVEDDPMVRKITVRILTELGYRVRDAADAAEALQILVEPTPIDLLFTDVVLPNGISGPGLAEMAIVDRPNLRVLYISGYTRNAVLYRGLVGGEAMLLFKPCTKSALAHKLREVLDRQ